MTAPLAVLRQTESLAAADLVVNATSLGLRGERFVPLAYAAAPGHCVFVDLIYGRDTDFLREARRTGHPTLDGSGMLLHQGAAAFRRWTGKEAPLDVMARALASTAPVAGIAGPPARSRTALREPRPSWR
jgi:shikimate dehydrogenase